MCDSSDADGAIDQRQGVAGLEVVEDVSRAIMQLPVNDRLRQAWRELGCRQVQDARGGNPNRAVMAQELLDFLASVALLCNRHEHYLARVTRDVAGVGEVAGDGSRVRLLESCAV